MGGSRQFRGGVSASALQKLVTYNTEDVVRLKAIVEMAYDQLAKKLSGTLWDQEAIFDGVAALPKTPRYRKDVSVRPARRCEGALGTKCNS